MCNPETIQALSAANTTPISPGSISEKQLNILRHAIGYDDTGNDRWPKARSLVERRNRFFTDPAGEDGQLCQALCALGLMADHGPQADAGGMHFYYVTENGRSVVMRVNAECGTRSAELKKSSRGQRRYKRFLEYGDCFRSFLDFCRWDSEPERSWNERGRV